MLPWPDASHGRDRYRATPYRGEGEGFAECALQICVPPLRPHRDQHACRDRADAAQPLPGSIATASTLAFALVHKYVDGTPLYRLAQAFERAGVPVSRGALGSLGDRLEREASASHL